MRVSPVRWKCDRCGKIFDGIVLLPPKEEVCFWCLTQDEKLHMGKSRLEWLTRCFSRNKPKFPGD